MVLFALVEPSTVKKGFQETHHHANCDRNGNELSNPRTMKMVTSIAWRQKKNWREKSDPFFANSIIACTEAKQSSTEANRGSKSNYSFSCLWQTLACPVNRHVQIRSQTRYTIAGKRITTKESSYTLF